MQHPLSHPVSELPESSHIYIITYRAAGVLLCAKAVDLLWRISIVDSGESCFSNHIHCSFDATKLGPSPSQVLNLRHASFIYRMLFLALFIVYLFGMAWPALGRRKKTVHALIAPC